MPSPQKLACPHCNKPCSWKPERAGKRVRCKCGQMFWVPETPGGRPKRDGGRAGKRAKPAPPPPTSPPPDDGPDPYDIDLPEDDLMEAIAPAAATAPAAGSPDGKCPSCNGPVRVGALICMNCGYNIAEGGKIKTKVEAPAPEPEPTGNKKSRRNGDKAKGSTEAELQADRLHNSLSRTAAQEEDAATAEKKIRFQENTLPVIMIVAGLLIACFNALVMQPALEGAAVNNLGSVQTATGGTGISIDRGRATATYFAQAGKLLVVQIPCLFAGLLICAALLGSAFGTLTSVLKKLLALCVLAGSFYLTVDLGVGIVMQGFGGLGWMFTFSIALAFFWVVILLLFDDLEFMEVQGLFVAMVLVPGFLVGFLNMILAG